MITRGRQLSLSWARSVQSKPPPTNFVKIHFYIILPSLSGFLPSRSRAMTLQAPLLLPIRATCKEVYSRKILKWTELSWVEQWLTAWLSAVKMGMDRGSTKYVQKFKIIKCSDLVSWNWPASQWNFCSPEFTDNLLRTCSGIYLGRMENLKREILLSDRARGKRKGTVILKFLRRRKSMSGGISD